MIERQELGVVYLIMRTCVLETTVVQAISRPIRITLADQAKRNFNRFFNRSYVKHLFGLKMHQGKSVLPQLIDFGDEDLVVPDSFDARDQWKGCTSLQQVRDQGPCGSCWAMSSAAAFTDRLCIASNGTFTGHLSAEQLLSCCTECADGCNGGSIDLPWIYLSTHGIVTGGDYHSNEGCQPYTLPQCEHHVPGPRKNCSVYRNVPTPKCHKTCYNKQYKAHTFENDHHKVTTPFQINFNNILVQKELYKYGPLTAGFNIYEDFLSYKSGVYQHTAGDFLSRHAVKIIGWGTENNTPYWLVANSWNSDWGDGGFFKIKRGANECNIEQQLFGGYAAV